ncbi:MAG: NPXTG-anchored protein [Oscillospiraceae bacterium]|nr:NPXTG-anchored protein [Oscillospiraceae bacterium]
MIDLYAVLGEDIYNLAKVDATFTWTAGTGWCGGAGLGNGAVTENGDTWLGGPEYGCANANADLVDAGTATQTILDITDNAIVEAASVNEDGETSFAALFVQNWWNGAEAGAQLTMLSFTDADGNVLGELTWGEEASEPTDSSDTNTNTTTPAQTDSKGSPDTGVAGVAAVAGVAVLAGVAVVVARKRK